MIDLSTGKAMTRRDVLRGGIASIIAAKSAPYVALGEDRGMMRNKGSQLSCVFGDDKPYDEELEYLESDGKQYVDTGISGVPGLKIHFEFFPVYPVSENHQEYLGGVNADNATGYRVRNGGSNEWNISVIVGSSMTWGVKVEADEWITFRTENGQAYLNDYSWKVGLTYPGNKLFLHALCLGTNPTRMSKVRVRKFIVDGLADYIPCLKNGVPCYYNATDNTFKYNQVSGHQFGYKDLKGNPAVPAY